MGGAYSLMPIHPLVLAGHTFKLRKTLAGVSLVIDVGGTERALRDHCPEGLAKSRGNLHGRETVTEIISHGPFKIELKETFLVYLGKRRIRRDICKIEHGSTKTTVFPINQPESSGISDKICGKEIMMPEN